MTDTIESTPPPPGGYNPFAVAAATLKSYQKLRANQPQLEDDMRTLKLMKIMYIAHGFHLALTDSPLTSTPIEAWVKGPVFPEIYDIGKFFSNRRRSLDPALFDGIVVNMKNGEADAEGLVDPTDITHQIIDRVNEVYGRHRGLTLSSATHKEGTPWHQFYRKGMLNIIDSDAIKKYYEAKLRKD